MSRASGTCTLMHSQELYDLYPVMRYMMYTCLLCSNVIQCVYIIYFFIDSLTFWICMACDKRDKGTQNREKRLSQ